jgi:hypothetical protein
MPFTRENAKAMGSKGGKATLARYGRGHYQELGRRGFAGLVRRIGAWNPHDVQSGRSQAIDLLAAKGRMTPRYRPVSPEEQAELDAWAEGVIDEATRDLPPAEDPDPLAGLNRLVDHVLASIRSAPLPAEGGL